MALRKVICELEKMIAFGSKELEKRGVSKEEQRDNVGKCGV